MIPGPYEHPQAVQSLREADDHLTPEETAKLAAYFCLLWFVANWALNVSLAYTSVASATVLSGMSGKGGLAVLINQRLIVTQAYLPWQLAAYFAWKH